MEEVYIMEINFKNYLFLVPFFSFITGYCVMQQLFHTPETITPHLIGKQVHEILPLITHHKLNIRLIDQKEEAALPEGIILNQTPTPGTAIKANQPLFVVTTKKPQTTRAPQCTGININTLLLQLQTTDIHPRIYYVSHPYPEKTCFAQSPQPHEPLEKNRLVVYVSSGNNKPIIWPNFTGMPLQHVVEFLNIYNIQPHIINDKPQAQSAIALSHSQKSYAKGEATADQYIVTDQRPFAGTLLTLDENKPLSVQLRVH
jgi:beta-lactam-binding protein with PASTA domain